MSSSPEANCCNDNINTVTVKNGGRSARVSASAIDASIVDEKHQPPPSQSHRIPTLGALLKTRRWVASRHAAAMAWRMTLPRTARGGFPIRTRG